jgi:uncharacterized protein
VALDRAIRWRPVQGTGLEHLYLGETDGGILARSVVIGEFDGVAFGARYEVRLDCDWTFRSLLLERTDGASLRLESDGRGTWIRNGTAMPLLAGCIDIDIAATPFTNTLPIRRTRFEPGVPQLFRMAWIPLDSLEPIMDEQIYTKRDGTHFRYQAADGSFEAELILDADGLVVDYPGLFVRG